MAGVSLGRPGWEVAYFITTALEPHHRVEEEMMLQRYHQGLVDAGVNGYSYEELIEDVLPLKPSWLTAWLLEMTY